MTRPDAGAADANAARAIRAFAAMERRFGRRDGLYRRDGWPRRPLAAAHLWPLARALVATLDVAGMASDVPFHADAAIRRHLRALERYWDPSGEHPAYASDVTGTRIGGDHYYDDNAWVGLALVQLERMRPGSGHLDRAAQLLGFAAAGWDHRPGAPSPGGVFWVQQGRGAGIRNHDRNTVSNAPHAELALHLRQLTGWRPAVSGGAGAEEMYGWVNATLDAGAQEGEPGTGLFWDKLRGDGTIDRKLWSYNQGSMIGANVLLARGAAGEPAAHHLGRAEAIARKALRHYAGSYERHPPAFNAIFFRNLLLLHAATADVDLQRQVVTAVRGYADRAWVERRDRHDLFRFSAGGASLLDQSAMVQVLALLAWDPADYGKLA
jgi:hypothetical protein